MKFPVVFAAVRAEHVSLPARGVWIEIIMARTGIDFHTVTPRKGSVD